MVKTANPANKANAEEFEAWMEQVKPSQKTASSRFAPVYTPEKPILWSGWMQSLEPAKSGVGQSATGMATAGAALTLQWRKPTERSWSASHDQDDLEALCLVHRMAARIARVYEMKNDAKK